MDTQTAAPEKPKDKSHSPSKKSKVNGASPGNLLSEKNRGQDKNQFLFEEFLNYLSVE